MLRPPAALTCADTDVMMTSQVVRTLERRGLLSGTADAADAADKRLTVTAAGSALAGRVIEVVEATDAVFFDRVDDRWQLVGILRQLADHAGPAPTAPDADRPRTTS